jgi:hypothetical protein
VDHRVRAIACRAHNVELAQMPPPGLGADVRHDARVRPPAHERLDIVAFGDERFDNSLSDGAAAACDEYTHAEPLRIGS